MGCEKVRGAKANGGTVVSRPETRVDGYSSPQAKKLVLQLSTVGLSYNNAGGVGLGGNAVYLVNIAMNNL